MALSDIWWDYWYFHLTNYALAVLMYTMLGRFALSVILKPDSPNYIYRWFLRLTEPVVRAIRFVTPSYVHDKFVPLCGFFWMGAARFAFYVVMFMVGLAPKLSGGGVG